MARLPLRVNEQIRLFDR